jgi:hypothetical protein
MAERPRGLSPVLLAAGRERLAEALFEVVSERYGARYADHLIDSGAVLVVDPTDPALVQRVAVAILNVGAPWDGIEVWLARAAIRAVFGDQ